MGIGSEMRKASLVFSLLVLLASLFFLSVLPNILSGYPVSSRQPDDYVEPPSSDVEEPSVVMFKVSPVVPQLFWRIWSEDFYNGQKWIRTSHEIELEELPLIPDANATEVFTVEINATEQATFLPLPSAQSAFGNVSLEYIEALRFYFDATENMYIASRRGEMSEVPLVFKASWLSVELDDRLISLNNTSEEILTKYLQLPNLPIEVWKLAQDLEDLSFSMLDQVLADVQFFRTNFVYDAGYARDLYSDIRHGSDISSFIYRKKGICIDAATALAIVLRIQKIPARISVGFKPGAIEDGKLLYYSSGAHAVTEVYLPPYGWIQFDATPPTVENPLVEVSPFKKTSSPRSQLFYQLTVTNRRNSEDSLKLFVENKLAWDVKIAPRVVRVEPNQTADALLEVAIPEDSQFGEKNLVKLTVVSAKHPENAFSIWAIVEVGDIPQISTSITLGDVDDYVIRGESIWVNGTVFGTDNEYVDDFTVFVFLTKSTKAEGLVVGKGHSEKGDFQIESATKKYIDTGEYKVITVFLGTPQYAPSTFESLIKVSATTNIEFGSEKEFLLGFGAIHGSLFWDNGTGFGNASVLFTITPLDASSDIWRLENKTCEDGSFRMTTSFPSPGTYEVQVIFPGSEFTEGSKAKNVLTLKNMLPEIQITGENSAIRGETYNFTATVQYENISVWGEPLTLYFDNQVLKTIETGNDGAYSCSFPVASEVELGPHYVIATLTLRDNISAVQTVTMKSRTRLVVDVSDVAGGMFLQISASLTDDHDLPIDGADIVLDNYGLSRETNRNGNLSLLLDTIRLWPEQSVVAARFAGSDLYMPATIQKDVVFEPVTSLPFIIPAVLSTSTLMTLVYAKHLVTKRKGRGISLQAMADTTTIEGELEEEQKTQPLKITFPDIETPPFPSVWGVNEQLCIQITADKTILRNIDQGEGEIEVTIDEKTFAKIPLEQKSGQTKLFHVFPKKGEHKIGAVLRACSLDKYELQRWKTEINLKVVDYSEETIRLYNEFLKKLAGYNINARDEMTAREIESLILSIAVSGLKHVGEVTKCFEKAEYSNHLVKRADYENMYMSLKESHMDVE